MAVRALTEDDVNVCRAIRLEALKTDPEAFESTFARESMFDDEVWRERLTGGDDRTNLILVDEIDGEVLGTAGVTIVMSDPKPMLVGMWVRPSGRRRGAARRLLESAVSWTRDQGFAELLLWVVRDNEAAIGLYLQFGFVMSGATIESETHSGVEEFEMRRSLR